MKDINGDTIYRNVTIQLSREEAQERRDKEAQEIFDEINHLHNKAQDLKDSPLETEETKLVEWQEGDPEKEKEYVLSHLKNESGRLGGIIAKNLTKGSPWLSVINKGKPYPTNNSLKNKQK